LEKKREGQKHLFIWQEKAGERSDFGPEGYLNRAGNKGHWLPTGVKSVIMPMMDFANSGLDLNRWPFKRGKGTPIAGEGWRKVLIGRTRSENLPIRECRGKRDTFLRSSP